jgi:histidine triad (HIT) family protein
MTTIPPYDEANIFARILRGEIPKATVYEDEAALAFMDIFPQSEGHTLVIPKRAKAAMIFDAPADDLRELIIVVQKIAQAVEKALGPDGVRIMQFNGQEAGQTVFHVHFHVIPVYAGKRLQPHQGGKPADQDGLRALAARIKAAL